MEPVKFVGMNTNYVAENCGDLPALVERQEDGMVCITSVWKPSEEELKTLNEGGCVSLAVYGSQPPVAMWVQKVETIVEDGNQYVLPSASVQWTLAGSCSNLTDIEKAPHLGVELCVRNAYFHG